MASAGPNFPSVGANDATVGTVAWSGTSNIFATDSVFATVSVSNTVSEYLVGTGFGFAIPAGATINGVQATVSVKSNNGVAFQNSVKLVKGGTVSGTNQSTGASLSTSTTALTFGSTSSLWGVSLTATDVNASNFGVAFSVTASGLSSVASVDSMTITVTYTLAIALQQATGTSTASATVSIPTPVPTATSASTSTASGAVAAATTIPLATCTATSTTSTIAPFNPPFQAANGTSTASINLTAPTSVPLAGSSGISTAAANVVINGLVPLASAAGTSTTGNVSLIAPFFMQLAPCVAQSGGILAPNSKRRAYLNRGATRLPPLDKEPNRAGWQPRRVGERASRPWASKF